MAKIALDAGHGLYTSGKRCHIDLDPKQTREWVLNDRVTDEVARLLKSAGHEVMRVDDTDGSTDISLAKRVQKANAWGADFYMSNHHNAAGKKKPITGGGTEVYVCVGASDLSIKAQKAIYKHAIARAGLKGDRSDGTRTANFYVIKNTKMPACLIECGFMDSYEDIKYILDPEWSKKIALGIAEGICEVFGGKINQKATTAKKPVAKKPAKLVETGNWDKKTTYAAQYVLKTTRDGIISNQPLVNKKLLLTASTESWKFEETGYKDGSNLIRAIQKLTGIPEKERDGFFGKDSVKALQRFLKKQKLYSGLISGKLNKATTIGFQKYLNKQMGY